MFVMMPFFPYARQDKTFQSREALRVETISKITNDLSCDEVITFDCHFIKKAGNFYYGGLRFINLSLSKELTEYFKSKASDPSMQRSGGEQNLLRHRSWAVPNKLAQKLERVGAEVISRDTIRSSTSKTSIINELSGLL